MGTDDLMAMRTVHRDAGRHDRWRSALGGVIFGRCERLPATSMVPENIPVRPCSEPFLSAHGNPALRDALEREQEEQQHAEEDQCLRHPQQRAHSERQQDDATQSNAPPVHLLPRFLSFHGGPPLPMRKRFRVCCY
jgi:hypothetical protein